MSNILSHVNYDGKVLDIKDSSTAPYIVTAPKNSDITTKLQTALNNGNVELLGGSYVVSKTITVPYGTTLNGNGAVIKPKYSNNFGDFVITINTYNGNNADDHSSTQTAVYNLNIDCLYKCSGIHLIQRGAKITGVNITNPIKSGYGIAVRLNPVNDTPGDMNITNCGVYSPDFNNHNHNIGLYIGATDCVVDGFRSIGSKIGIEMASTSGANFLCNCHPLAFNSTTNGWDDTVGFDVNASVYMINCYSDNFRYGLYIHNSAFVGGDNFYSQYYETNKNIKRYAVFTDSNALNLNIRNLYLNYTTVAVGASSTLDQRSVCRSLFTTHYTDYNEAYWFTDDYGRLISKGGRHYYVSAGEGNKETTIAVITNFGKTLSTAEQCLPPVKVDIITSQFAINGLIIKQTTTPDVTVYDWGTFVPSKQEIGSGTTAGVTINKYVNNGVIYFTLSSPVNCHYWQVDVYADETLLFLPTVPIGYEGEVEESHVYSVTA